MTGIFLKECEKLSGGFLINVKWHLLGANLQKAKTFSRKAAKSLRKSEALES